MKPIKFTRLALGLNFDHLIRLLKMNKGIIKRAEESEVRFNPNDNRFIYWMHSKSITWCDKAFFEARMNKAYHEVNGASLQELEIQNQFNKRQRSLLIYQIEKVKRNYAFDIKAYAALSYLNEELGDENMAYKDSLRLNADYQHSLASGSRYKRLVKLYKQLAYLEAEIQCLESLKQITFEDPDGFAIR
jgi:hypothetical protein